MKKVLSSLFAAYVVLNNGQPGPPQGGQSCTSSCAFTFIPVCGVDNQVYLNQCLANCLGIAIQYNGECTSQQTPPQQQPQIPPAQPPPQQPVTPIIPPQVRPIAPPPPPTTKAPTTRAPTTRAPTTRAPTTAAPTTAAPTTSAPTTAAPTKYINPYCPADLVFQNIGNPPPAQLPQSILGACWESPTLGSNKYVSDFDGFLQCNPFSCCACDYIGCGGTGVPCKIVKFSDYGAIGAPFINVQGPPRLDSMMGIVQHGAEIDCGGLESCKAANILGQFVQRMACNGDYGCQSSQIIINNPYPDFDLLCNGMKSCQAANIEINLGEAPPPGKICDPNYIPTTIELGEIKFGGSDSGLNAVLTINNVGCDKVFIRRLDCGATSCGGTQFLFNGNIEVQSCNMPATPFPSPELARCSGGGVAAPIGRVTCNDPVSCVNQVKTIKNPGSGFELECGLAGSCNGLQLTLDYGLDPAAPTNYITNIAGFYFNAPNAAVGAVITINNNQHGVVQGSHGQIMELNTVKCIVGGACNGLTIRAGPNVDILNTAIDCSVPNSCTGCTFEQDGIMPYPCDYAEPVQAPQAPQAPQQLPQFPQPQQPLPINPNQVRPVNPFTVGGIPAPQRGSPWIPAPSPVV